jgi:cysteinyl-tRNA synthetase
MGCDQVTSNQKGDMKIKISIGMLMVSAFFSWGLFAGDILKPLPLSQVKYFAYQIQGLEDDGAVDKIAESKYDLVVIEPTRTVSDENRSFDTRKMVAKIQNSKASDGIHRKIVIAYLNIGEAEDWRWYWKWSKQNPKKKGIPSDWPKYIVKLDPDGWAGNYPVKFWSEDWKDLVIYGRKHKSSERDFSSMLDEVLKDGFDGIYLDWVEAYAEKDVVAAAKAEGINPSKEMVSFIREMKEYGRKSNADFIVIQQNAASLAEEEPDILNVVDAIGQEDAWYGGGPDVKWENPKGYDRKQKPGDTREIRRLLGTYKKAGKTVFTIDYTVKHAGEVYRNARTNGFVPYCTRTHLGKLTTTPPY